MKRFIDLAFVSIAVVPILILCIVLFFANPLWNPGPLFFVQERMGYKGRKFRMYKFRTMVVSHVLVRTVDAPLEWDRITKLGRFLRKSHLDELPNAFNILLGEMTLVGPRPDAWDHSIALQEIVPHYRKRIMVRPGITGLAQIRSGYADTVPGIKRKARLDAIYVRKNGTKMDIIIISKTARKILTGSDGW